MKTIFLPTFFLIHPGGTEKSDMTVLQDNCFIFITYMEQSFMFHILLFTVLNEYD